MRQPNYLNLYLDAGISDRRDQERYDRFLDAVIAEEGITVADIVGIGEKGTNASLPLYVVHRDAISFVDKIGIFKNKRIQVDRVCPISSIDRLRTTREGSKGSDLTITGNDAAGEEVLKIIWGLGGPDWVEPLVERQREHLFGLISAAIDQVGSGPSLPSVSAAWSKAGALMDWAAGVVRASGVEVTRERVEEHADMIAAVTRLFVFLPAVGLDDLSKLYPNGDLPPGRPIDTYDELYERVVARVGSAQTVDAGIDEYLAAAWNEYVRGCRETYS